MSTENKDNIIHVDFSQHSGEQIIHNHEGSNIIELADVINLKAGSSVIINTFLKMCEGTDPTIIQVKEEEKETGTFYTIIYSSALTRQCTYKKDNQSELLSIVLEDKHFEKAKEYLEGAIPDVTLKWAYQQKGDVYTISFIVGPLTYIKLKENLGNWADNLIGRTCLVNPPTDLNTVTNEPKKPNE